MRSNNGTEYKRMLEQLALLRQRCLRANRNGDFRRVAQLTLETAQVNARLQENASAPTLQFQ